MYIYEDMWINTFIGYSHHLAKKLGITVKIIFKVKKNSCTKYVKTGNRCRFFHLLALVDFQNVSCSTEIWSAFEFWKELGFVVMGAEGHQKGVCVLTAAGSLYLCFIRQSTHLCWYQQLDRMTEELFIAAGRSDWKTWNQSYWWLQWEAKDLN